MNNAYFVGSSQTACFAGVALASLFMTNVGSLNREPTFSGQAQPTYFIQQTDQTGRTEINESADEVNREILNFFVGMAANQQPREELDSMIPANLWDLYD